MPERSADWIKQAKRDLEMAKKSREACFYEWACFIAQQAAEKAVKAVYQSRGGSAIGHGIGSLLRGLEVKVPVPKDILKSAKAARWLLYSFAIPGWHGTGVSRRSF